MMLFADVKPEVHGNFPIKEQFLLIPPKQIENPDWCLISPVMVFPKGIGGAEVFFQ